MKPELTAEMVRTAFANSNLKKLPEAIMAEGRPPKSTDYISEKIKVGQLHVGMRSLGGVLFWQDPTDYFELSDKEASALANAILSAEPTVNGAAYKTIYNGKVIKVGQFMDEADDDTTKDVEFTLINTKDKSNSDFEWVSFKDAKRIAQTILKLLRGVKVRKRPSHM